MRTKQPRGCRIVVNVPREMFDFYKERSDVAGLSMSRLVYQMLRSRRPAVIVPPAFVSEVKALRADLKAAVDSGSIPEEQLELISHAVEFYAKFVDDNCVDAIKGGNRHEAIS